MARAVSSVGLQGEVSLGASGYLHTNENWRGGGEGSTPGTAVAGTSTAYQVGDTVVHNGSIYIAARANDNVEPGGIYDRAGLPATGNPGRPEIYWTLIAGANASGVTSISSPIGITERFQFPGRVSGGISVLAGTNTINVSNPADPLSSTTINTLRAFGGLPPISATDTGIFLVGTTTIEFSIRVLDGRSIERASATVPVGANINLIRLNPTSAPGQFDQMSITGVRFPDGTTTIFSISPSPLTWVISRDSRLTGDVSINGNTQVDVAYNEDANRVDVSIPQGAITTDFIGSQAVSADKVTTDIVTVDRLRDAPFTGTDIQEVVLTGTTTNNPSSAARNEQIRFILPNDFNAGSIVPQGARTDILTSGAYALTNGTITDPTRTIDEARQIERGYDLESIFRNRTVPGSLLLSSTETVGTTSLANFDAFNTNSLVQGGDWSTVRTILVAPSVGGDTTAIDDPDATFPEDLFVIWVGPLNWAVYRVAQIQRFNIAELQSQVRHLRVEHISSQGTVQTSTTRETTDEGSSLYRPMIFFRGNRPAANSPVVELRPATFSVNVDTAGTVFNAGAPFNITTGSAEANETITLDEDNNNAVTLMGEFPADANAGAALVHLGERLTTLFGPRTGEPSTQANRVSVSPPVPGTGVNVNRFEMVVGLNRMVDPADTASDLEHVFTVQQTRPSAGAAPSAMEVDDGADVQDSVISLRSPDGRLTTSFNAGRSTTRLAVANRLVGFINGTAVPESPVVPGYTARAIDNPTTNTTRIIMTSLESINPNDIWRFFADHEVGPNSSATTAVTTSQLPAGQTLIGFNQTISLATGGSSFFALNSDNDFTNGAITTVPAYPREDGNRKYTININQSDVQRFVQWDEEFIDSTRNGMVTNLAPQTAEDTLSIRGGAINFEHRPTLDGMDTLGGVLFQNEVEANQATLPPIADRRSLQHLRIGNVVYDIPVGNTLTELTTTIDSPIAAWAGAQRKTFTVTPRGGTIQRTPLPLVTVTRLDGSVVASTTDATNTIALRYVGDNMLFDVQFPNQTALTERYTVDVVLTLQDGTTGEHHVVSDQERYTVTGCTS